jgi:hypothetical protein
MDDAQIAVIKDYLLTDSSDLRGPEHGSKITRDAGRKAQHEIVMKTRSLPLTRPSRISHGDAVSPSGFLGMGTPEELIALIGVSLKLRGGGPSETRGPGGRAARSATD